MRAARTALMILVAVGARPAAGQDYPGPTFLYGTIDDDSLTVECRPPLDGKMQCKFAQTLVSKPATHKDFEKELSKEIDEALSSNELRQCKGMQEVANAIKEGGIPPGVTDIQKYRTAMAAMKPGQKADMVKQFDLMGAFCEAPSRQTAEAFLRAGHDKDMRSCKILTTSYEQGFVTADFGKTWISNEGPVGECGVVYISKFEKAKDQDIFWVYYTQKVVTKKDGDPILNLCEGLDERKFFYDWKQDEKYLQCDYIKFGF